MKIKVLIADDHLLFREGVVKLLLSSSEIEVVAQAKDGKDAIEKARQFTPDVVLIDIGMPVMNGIEATKVLKQEMPKMKVIAVSMHSDKQYVSGVLKAGADGYLLKNTTYQQLTEAIKSVHNGKKTLSDDITNLVISGYLQPSTNGADDLEKLSEREREVLKLFAEGDSTREIAEKLFISVKTVGTHKQHILEKLDLKTTTDMIKYSLKNGLISM